MKKIISLILCVALMCTFALALTSCGENGKSLEEIQAEGKLVVATSPDFAPFEYLEGTTATGIEVDIMTIVCEKLGVELVIEEIAFDSVLPGVQTGKYDCGMSGITVTDERKENVLFTDVYYVAAQAIVVKADSAIKSKADLAGKKVSVQLGTTADSFCREEGYTVDSYEANADAKLALTTDKVDAWVIDDLIAKNMVAEGDGLIILEEKMTEEPYAFAFNFEDEELVEKIDEVLVKLIENGTVKSIFEKHGESYEAPNK